MAKGEFSVSLSVVENGRNRPDYTLDSDLQGEMTLQDLLEWTRTALIVTADEVLKEAQGEGFDKEPILVVDGKQGAAITTVSPLGQIEFISRQNFGTILQEAYDGVWDRSPILTGRYKSSHYVFLNGVQVARDIATLEAYLETNPTFKDGDTIRIVNIQPYARRLERLGVTAQRKSPRLTKNRKTGKSVVSPNGAYQLTTRSIKAKYKQNVLIKFAFLPGTSLGLTGSFKGGRKGKNSAGRPYLYPSLVFTIQERGII